MLSKREKQALRDEAKATELVIVDGVMVGVPKGQTDEERAAYLANAVATMGDPNSQYSIDKQRREAARQRFDKRRTVLAQAIAAKAKQERDQESSIDWQNAGA